MDQHTQTPKHLTQMPSNLATTPATAQPSETGSTAEAAVARGAVSNTATQTGCKDWSAKDVFQARKLVYDAAGSRWDSHHVLLRLPRPGALLGEGGLRRCYEVMEVVGDEEVPLVAKFFKRREDITSTELYLGESMAQCMCEEFAINFVLACKTVHRPQHLSFVPCAVVKISAWELANNIRGPTKHFLKKYRVSSGDVVFIMEPKLSGEFVKYTDNRGTVFRGRRGRQELINVLEAFSHFTLVESGGSMLVCDLQGVGDYLTDPQIHTEDGKGMGSGNCGSHGIRKWIRAHHCTSLCQQLGMKELILPSGVLTAEEQRRYWVRSLKSNRPTTPRALLPLRKPLAEMDEHERVSYAIQLSRLLEV